MKVAFIFDGQGGSKESLGQDFYKNNEFVHDFIEEHSYLFNMNKKIYNTNPVDLTTEELQPAIFLYETAVARLLEKNGIVADATAGSSLGEYSSLCYANILNVKDTLAILKKRSKLMREHLLNFNSGMKAIMFLEKEIVEECVKKFDDCEISNVNSPNQVIISGLNNELELCASMCVEMGARKVIDLNVDGAFHSKFLKKASTEFLEYIKDFNYGKGNKSVYFNYTGNNLKTDIPELLSKQLYSKVLFCNIIENMLEDGIDTFYEIGPGGNLGFHINSIARFKEKKIKVYQISDYESYCNLIEKREGEAV